MKRYFFISIQLLAIAFSCRTFGQSSSDFLGGPKLIVGRKVVDFDPKFVSEPSEKLRFQLLAKTRIQIASAQIEGIERIGNVELTHLASQLDKVKFKMVSDDAEAVGVGEFIGRGGAVYFVESNTVFVNQKALRKNKDRTFSLMPHEIVGALGIDDRNSQFTTLLSNPKANRDLIDKLSKPDSDFPQKLRKSPKKEMQINNGEQSGGVTVVGGGGDEIIHELKRTIFSNRTLYRRLIKDVILKDPKHLHGATEAYGFDFMKYFNDENVLAQYDLYLLNAPIEAADPEKLKSSGPLKSSADIYSVVWVSRVDDVGDQRKIAFPGPYLRFSRDHWNFPLGELSLDVSRHYYGMFAYLGLFPEWLTSVYLVELQKASQAK